VGVSPKKLNFNYFLNYLHNYKYDKVKKNILLIFILLLIFKISYSQEKEIQPWSWFGYAGFLGVESSEKSLIGKREALFTDYNTSILLGFGGLYAYNKHFAMGPNLRIGGASKENFNIGILGLGTLLKYNFLETSRKFSPYFFIEPNFSYISMSRTAHDITDPSPSNTGGFNITQIDVNVSAANASSNVWGLSSGLGLDYRIAQRWRIYSELGVNRHFTASSSIFKDNFKNVTALKYTTLNVGVRCDMVQIKKIKDKDKNNILARISKDSLSNKGNLSIVGKLQGVQQNGDGVMVLLVNEKGEIIKQTLSDKEGYFVFTKIDKENYEVRLENPALKLTAKTFTENDESVLMLEKSNLNDLKNQNSTNAKEIVIGQAINKITNQPASNIEVFLLNKDNELVAKTTTDKNGHFAYKDLPPSDYKILFSTEYPTLKSVITYALSDSDLSILGDSINPNSNVIIHGKVLGQLGKDSLGQEILLIDSKGNIIKSTTADKDGYFAFTKIPGVDYHVVIKSNDHKLKLNTNYEVVDPSLFVDQATLPKFKYNTLINDNTAKNIEQVLTGKVTAKTPNENIEDLSMLLIDGEGNVVEKVKTDKEGNFKFTKLSPANYQVVFEQKNKNLRAEVFVPDDNTALIINKNDLDKFNFKKIQKDTSETHNITINGITRHAKSNEPLEDISVLLIDADGNVIRREKTNKDGVFNFKHLSSENYQIRIESNNKNIKANFQVFDDQSSLIANESATNQQPDTLLGTIYYNKNVFILDKQMISSIDKLIKYFKIHKKDIKIINLDAYGDASGTDEYNLWLTQKRAQAIYNYLVSKGINKKIINMHPYGKALSIDNKNSIADPQLNRKTDIKVIK
jgi:outer membrane protein OmpA-like peptidoglycan-associated protein